jgi:tubulin--tyrosine ligase
VKTLPNAFEVFGLDYLIDEHMNAWLLEVNAFPDFAQTGDELKGIVAGLFDSVVQIAVMPFFGLEEKAVEGVQKVLDVSLGRR